jgi:hypothetical protein
MNQDDPRKGIFLDIVKINEKQKGKQIYYNMLLLFILFFILETKFICQF